MKPIRSILYFITFMCVSIWANSQVSHWSTVRYFGDYRVVYFDDSLAFRNLVLFYPESKTEDKNELINNQYLRITDTAFLFDTIYTVVLKLNYKFMSPPKKKKGKIYFLSRSIVKPEIHRSRYYRFKIFELANGAYGLKFKNIKPKYMNLMNPTAVKEKRALARYYPECYNKLYIIIEKINKP